MTNTIAALKLLICLGLVLSASGVVAAVVKDSHDDDTHLTGWLMLAGLLCASVGTGVLWWLKP